MSTPITDINTLDKVVTAPDEYMSVEQPDPDWMRKHNKKFWIQPEGSGETSAMDA